MPTYYLDSTLYTWHFALASTGIFGIESNNQENNIEGSHKNILIGI